MATFFGIEPWLLKNQRSNISYNKELQERLSGVTTLKGFESLAQEPVGSRTPKPTGLGGFGSVTIPSFSFRGGQLTKQQFEKASWLEQEEAQTKLEESFEEAKTANLARYEEILGGYDTRYGTAIESLKGLGDEERAAVRRAYGRSEASQLSGAVKQGLVGTTVPAALTRENTRGMTDALSLLNERINRQKIGLQTSLSGEKLGFQERREDAYPDVKFYMDLFKQFGNI